MILLHFHSVKRYTTNLMFHEVTAHGIGVTKFQSLVLNFLPETLPLVCAKVKGFTLRGPLRAGDERRWRRPSKCRSVLHMQADGEYGMGNIWSIL